MTTSKPRIPLPEYEQLDAQGRAVFDRMRSGRRGAVQGPIRAVVHNPELAQRWQHLGHLLRYETSIPERASELAIVTVAAYWNAPLEWALHRAHAHTAGISDDLIVDVWTTREPSFAEDSDAEVHRFTLETLSLASPSDAAYEAMLTRFTVVGVVELTALVGYYSMVALTLNSHQIPPPAGVELPENPSWRVGDLHA